MKLVRYDVKLMMNVVIFWTVFFLVQVPKRASGSRAPDLPATADSAHANKVMRKWEREITSNGGTMTHAEAVSREAEVVRKINEGTWPIEAYHEYQLMAAGSGNVDSAGLLLSYSLDPAMQKFFQKKHQYPLHAAAAGCDARRVEKLLPTGSDYGDEESGLTALMAAVYVGCTEAVQTLIREGSDVHATSRSGMNAVMIAASAGHSSIIRVLVREGNADINAKHKFAGTTAFHMAAELNQSHAINELCRLGVDVSATTSLGATALHIAAQTNAIQSIRPLVRSCHLDIDELMNNDTTALYLASQHGYAGFVDVLLREGANVSYHMPFFMDNTMSRHLTTGNAAMTTLPLNSEAANGAEAIHAAAENGHLNVIKSLLNHGANINSVSIGVSPVHLAVQYGKLHVAKFLVANDAAVDYPSAVDGTTPLYYAAGMGMSDMVKLLLEAGASCTSLSSQLDSFPLLYASAMGHALIVKMMLAQEAIDPNFTNSNKVTALHEAAAMGRTRVVDILLRQGGLRSMQTATMSDGFTPLHQAIRGEHYVTAVSMITCLKELLPHDKVSQIVNTYSFSEGCTPLHYIMQRQSSELTSFTKILSALLSVGAHIDSRISKGSVHGATAMYIGAASGNVEAIRILLKHGADPNIALDEAAGAFTPLIAAIDRQHVNVVETLLTQTGAYNIPVDLNLGCGNSYSQSPLLLAIVKGNSAIVDILLAAGADCSLRVARLGKNQGGGQTGEAQPVSESLFEFSRHLRHYDVMQILGKYHACSLEMLSSELEGDGSSKEIMEREGDVFGGNGSTRSGEDPKLEF